MERWDSIFVPIRRVWTGVAVRLGFRQTGLLKLDRDVRDCEYEDVHVMWHMLVKNETEHGNCYKYPRRSKKRNCWKIFQCRPSCIYWRHL